MLRRYIDKELNTIRGGSGGDPATEGVVVRILVDGGIHRGTSSLVKRAGADILVAGTALFRHPQGFEAGVRELI